MRRSSKTSVPAESTWYIVDDQTVVQSWFNPERERTEYVQYSTSKRVAEHQLRTADVDFNRAYRSGEGLLLALVVLAFVAITRTSRGRLLLLSSMVGSSSLPLLVLVVSGVTLAAIFAGFAIYRPRRLARQRRFVADLGFDQRNGHTLKKRQVDEFLHAPNTVTVRPAP